jgi:hypothetical protein
VKKPLTALALAAATVAMLTVPAGATTTKPKVTWSHQTVRCASGHKSATWVQKWQGGQVVNSWADNRCKDQWLVLITCLEGDRCGAHDIAPKTKRHTGPGWDTAGFHLQSFPYCDGGETDCPV